MNIQENRQKWIAALESGEYNQGRRMLRSKENQYCCLGVLCEVYKKETGEGIWIDLGDVPVVKDKYTFRIDGISLTGVPSDKILNWAGINTLISASTEDYIFSRLITMNDNEARTFQDIANAIRTAPMPTETEV